ncbi:MAG: hypothetical protein F4044_05020 [Rhodobacteraceae bacterium]|nr:hypothetical protein [Paracoccaceae bacterium]
MFALVDCNNFYASCERVFRPDITAGSQGAAGCSFTEFLALSYQFGFELTSGLDLNSESVSGHFPGIWGCTAPIPHHQASRQNRCPFRNGHEKVAPWPFQVSVGKPCSALPHQS